MPSRFPFVESDSTDSLLPPSRLHRQVHVSLTVFVLVENMAVKSILPHEASRVSSCDARRCVHQLPDKRACLLVPLAGRLDNQTGVGESYVSVGVFVRVVAHDPV